jgi:Transglycosylase SLT domain/Domain of unknown function (DUF4124)
MSALLSKQLLPASLVALALVFLSAEARADIYQCKDPEGNVLFTDSPTRSGCQVLIGHRTARTAQTWSSSGGDPARFDGLISSSSQRYGVDSALVRAVVKVESDFNEGARSHKGAQGLMQLMPDTARLHNVANAYDPEENIEGGVRHLRLLLDRYQGNLQLTLAAYNAGIQAVDKYRGIPPFSETKEYVRRVLSYHQRYLKDGTLAVSEDTRTRQ